MNAAAALGELRELDRINGDRRAILETQIRDFRLKIESLNSDMAEMTEKERSTQRDDYDRMGEEVGYYFEQIDYLYSEIRNLTEIYRKAEKNLFSRDTAEAKPLLTRVPFPDRAVDFEVYGHDRPLKITWDSSHEEAYLLTSITFNRFTEEGGLSPQVAALLTQAWSNYSGAAGVSMMIDSK